ncbi:hypothetical protein [Providencia phage PSTRCR_121]|nr:hypothetical protein [Providencia phage PSTRCR_121]
MNFVIPIYSMRSYKTGKYSLLKDGNLQLHLNRHQDGDIIGVPLKENCEDLDLLKQYFPHITFQELFYSKNAYKTRSEFWSQNSWGVDQLMDFYGCDALVTDVTGYKGPRPFFNNFNITMDPEVERPYIDEFIYTDVDSVNRSVYTTVLNECQKEVLVRYGVEPDLIYVNQRVVKPGVPEAYLDGHEPITVDGVFFPFRISDKCYDFEGVYNSCYEQGVTMIVTDPNDTLVPEVYTLCRPIKPSKQEYYAILSSKPVIDYRENAEKVFHPGLAEFIYFGCKIISDYNIPSIDQIIVKGPTWQI